jgi:hypothetical protein
MAEEGQTGGECQLPVGAVLVSGVAQMSLLQALKLTFTRNNQKYVLVWECVNWMGGKRRSSKWAVVAGSALSVDADEEAGDVVVAAGIHGRLHELGAEHGQSRIAAEKRLDL